MAKKEDNSAEAGVAARQKAMEQGNAEYYAREAASKPTPTQRENDLAKVGALGIDDKEDDGSESEEDRQRRMMEARVPGGNPYDTRALDFSATRKPAPAPQPAPRPLVKP